MTVERRADGRYAVDWPGKGPFLTLSELQLVELVYELANVGLVTIKGQKAGPAS